MQQLPLKAIARWTLFLLLLSVQGALLLPAINVRSSIAVDHFCFRLLCVHMAVCGECKEGQIFTTGLAVLVLPFNFTLWSIVCVLQNEEAM